MCRFIENDPRFTKLIAANRVYNNVSFTNASSKEALTPQISRYRIYYYILKPR
jgi:hypothetical protein